MNTWLTLDRLERWMKTLWGIVLFTLPVTLEEMIYHSLQSGHINEAWDIYSYRMGGFANLGDIFQQNQVISLKKREYR